MKKDVNKYTNTYLATGDYYVDTIQEQQGSGWYYEAWLYKKDYGIKVFMFGLCDCETFNDFLEIVSDNIMDYISDYKEEYEH